MTPRFVKLPFMASITVETDASRVINYNLNMFIVQATSTSKPYFHILHQAGSTLKSGPVKCTFSKRDRSE